MRTLATFARLCVSDLDGALELLGPEPPRLRFAHASGLELALVGDVLVLAGPDEVLAPFRETRLTVVVDDLQAALARADRLGAEVVRPPARQPTGENATVRLPFGAVVEYVAWDARTREAAGLPEGGR